MERDQLGVKLRKGGQESLRKSLCASASLKHTFQQEPGDAAAADDAARPFSEQREAVLVNQHALISTAFKHACQVMVPASERHGSFEIAIFVAGLFITAMRLYGQN